MTDTEDFFAQFADELNDPKALSLEEIQRAMPAHGDTRESMIARNNRNNPKRLTNAELAAEYWCSEWRKVTPETSDAVKILSAERAEILHRFATLPHYDEVTE